MAVQGKARWRNQIIDAFETLGGSAQLASLYTELERRTGTKLTSGQRAGVRREIENHSSDSDNYRPSRQDLFETMGGTGSGHWALRSRSSIDDDQVQDGAEAFIETEEGRQKLRVHLSRERSRSLIQKFKSSLKSLACEICKFDFQEKYGPRGKGYIEAHHTIPIAHLMTGSKTKTSDLIAVCANCHRMLHSDGLISANDLKAIIKN